VTDSTAPAATALARESLLIADTEAAALAGVSRRTWRRLLAAGKVPLPVKLGRCVRWRSDELRRWVGAGCPDARTWAAMEAIGRRSARAI
jgi:excisionase family DNA binding protein